VLNLQKQAGKYKNQIKSLQMKALLSIFLLVYSGFALCQLNMSGLEKQSFLIGTLDDSMGHQQTITATKDSTYFQLIDVYSQDQKYIALLIDSLFKTEYTDFHMTNNGSPKGIRLYSKSLSLKVNGYFNYLPSGIFTAFHDTIYTGYIQPEQFNQLEKLSFLTGAFLRNGGKTNANEYFFTLPNSTSKAKLCVDLLKEFNCLDVKHIILNNIPVGNWITFKPGEKVLSMIKRVENIKKVTPFPSTVLNYIMTRIN